MINSNSKTVPVSTVLNWKKVASKCANPLGLDDTIVENSKEVCPPVEYEGGTYLGRYLIPDVFVRYNSEEQPRDKNNDKDHVNNLVNGFTVQGYRMTENPPIVCFDECDVNTDKLRGQSGFNRKEARERIGQEMYIFDVYEWESSYWEAVARNQSNHHNNPQLVQTKNDYLKEVVNAVKKNLITNDQIDDFVDRIAADKTDNIRRWIKKNAHGNCQTYPTFRTYRSTGTDAGSLAHFATETVKLPQPGINNRNLQEIVKQGYVYYNAGQGDNMQSWARGIQYGIKYGVPVWVFGYAPERVSDLLKFRKDFVKDFLDMKDMYVKFASLVGNGGETITVDENDWPIKLAGFYPQYIQPNPENEGKPTEHTYVDVNGQPIKFDPDGDCLTLR